MKSKKTLSRVGRNVWIACGFLLLCFAVWLGTVFFAIARQQQENAEKLAKAAIISAAIQTSYDANKVILPRVFRNRDPRVRTGTPLYSWRATVSEFMKLSGPYRWMDHHKEWNSPENADALANYMDFEWQLIKEPKHQFAGATADRSNQLHSASHFAFRATHGITVFFKGPK